jgi:hypothetical protein
LSTDTDAILGTDFLGAENAKLDLEAKKLWVLKNEKLNHDSLARRLNEARGTAERVALTVFSAADGRGKGNSYSIGCKKSETTSRSQKTQHIPKISIKESDSWLVKATETIKIAPRVKQMVVGKSNYRNVRLARS